MSTMPVAEPITAEEYLANPPADFARAQSLTSPLLPELALALDTVFASDEITT